MEVIDLIKKFENKAPEIVFEWKDQLTEAEGWVVINSLRGGAAGGGTRMRKGLNRYEVLSLAKTMEIKFAVCGPDIGGAKSGINFDPQDPRKQEVLERWFKAVIPLLKTYYGTGGDLNVDEVKEVINITSEYGLHHPQEGVLKGHYDPAPADFEHKIVQLQKGVSFPVTTPEYSPSLSRDYLVADLITGWGVSEAVRHYFDVWGGNIKGKKAIIQGWGNVAAAAAYYLAQAGALIVGVIDKNGGLINEDGFQFSKVRELFNNKIENELVGKDLLSFEEVNKRIWDVQADIFIPGAASRLVNKNHLKRLKKAGVEVISCGANVPFDDQDIFFGDTARFADENFAVIPDFIANCGMARTFAYLMQSNISLSDKAIFGDVSDLIRQKLSEVKEINSANTKITESSFIYVLKKLI